MQTDLSEYNDIDSISERASEAYVNRRIKMLVNGET